MITFILAFSHRDFESYLRFHLIGFDRKDVVLLRDTNQLRGIRQPLRVIATEMFLAHGDDRFHDEVRQMVGHLNEMRER